MKNILLSKLRYRLVFVLLLLCIVTGYLYNVVAWKSESEKLSEKVIREAAAKILNKDPNQLSTNDFKKITKFYLTDKVLSDIKLIKKFTNLQEFRLNLIYIPKDMNTQGKSNFPKWKKFLLKFGIIKTPQKTHLDLSPLRKLTNLEEVKLFMVPTNNIKPLAKLSKLKILRLSGTNVSDIKPLRNLINLQELEINVNNKTDYEILKKLKNLQKMELYGTSITNEQIDDLQKSLPNTTIKYYYIGF